MPKGVKFKKTNTVPYWNKLKPSPRHKYSNKCSFAPLNRTNVSKRPGRAKSITVENTRKGVKSRAENAIAIAEIISENLTAVRDCIGMNLIVCILRKSGEQGYCNSQQNGFVMSLRYCELSAKMYFFKSLICEGVKGALFPLLDIAVKKLN